MFSRQLRLWIGLVALATAASCELNPQPPIPDAAQGSGAESPGMSGGGSGNSAAGSTSAGTTGGASSGGSLAIDVGGAPAEIPVDLPGAGAGGDNAGGNNAGGDSAGGDNSAGSGG